MCLGLLKNVVLLSFTLISIPKLLQIYRRAYHGGQGRVDHHYKGKFNNQDDDGWQKKFDVITASNIESSDDIHAFGTEDTENSVIHSVMDGGQPSAESYDSTDIQAQVLYLHVN